jgi:CRP-like cAMP-binding protein
VDDAWFLKQIDWLQELDEGEWAELQKRGTRQHFAEGQMVFQPSRDPQSVYLLESGRVRIYRLSSEGEEATLGYVAPGEVFGELPGFGNFARESFASAAVLSAVWKIPVDVFRALVRTRPKLVIEVTRQIGERMKRVESRVESLVFRNVSSRVALALLELAEDFGERVDAQDGEQWTLSLGLSQRELATLVGTSRQSINEVLGRFRERGLVLPEGAVLRLPRLAALRRVADGGTA